MSPPICLEKPQLWLQPLCGCRMSVLPKAAWDSQPSLPSLPWCTPSRAPPSAVQVQTLRKYTKQYEVQGVHPTSTKEDIARAVTEHWNSVVRRRCWL